LAWSSQPASNASNSASRGRRRLSGVAGIIREQIAGGENERHGAADRGRKGALALHDVAGRVRGRAEAVRIGLAAAGGENLEVFSPTIGHQLLELGRIDEIDLHIAPILLGEGIRLYDNPGGEPIRLHRVGSGDPTSAVDVRYRPITTPRIPT
jgi:hypothetical protein